MRVGKSAGRNYRGRVEAVNRPGSRYPYSAEVLVEFEHDGTDAEALRTSMLTVVVHPSHRQDSVLSVPRQAIVHLGGEAGVFVQVNPGTYELIWVRPGPEQGEAMVVAGHLHPQMRIAVSGLMPLAAAAAESLAVVRRQQDQRR